MKPSRRVLLIARHFWPETEDDTLRLRAWAEQLHREGAEVTVATPRWNSRWPRQIICNGVMVKRIDFPPAHPLRTGRYMRQLGNWVASMRDKFDMIYCDQADIEAHAVLDYVPQRLNLPLVVRYTPPDSAAIEISSPTARELDICRRAAMVIVSSATSERRLLAAGLNRASIVRCHQTLGASYDRSSEARRQARQVLADVNSDLFLKSNDRLLVCPGELRRSWGVDTLLSAVVPLVERHRSLRIWILGDSRERSSLYDALRHEGVHRLIAMPGIFTDLEEVIKVADLCVFPAADKGLGWLLPTCIASSVPFLAADSPSARQVLGTEAERLLFASGDACSLRERLAAWLHNANSLAASVSQVRKHTVMSASPSLSCNVLFQSLEASA